MKIYFVENIIRNGIDEAVIIASDETEARKLAMASSYDKDAHYFIEEIGMASHNEVNARIVTHNQWRS